MVRLSPLLPNVCEARQDGGSGGYMEYCILTFQFRHYLAWLILGAAEVIHKGSEGGPLYLRLGKLQVDGESL